MASVLDVGLLQFFSPVFLFILIFAIVYAIIDKFDIFKGKWIKSAIALCMGILFLFSKDAMTFVNFVTPWFLVFVVVIFLFLAIFLFMGVKGDALSNTVKNPNVYWTVLIILFILLIASLVHVFGGEDKDIYPEGETTEDGVKKTRESEGLSALISPKLLGAIILLVIITLAVALLSKSLG